MKPVSFTVRAALLIPVCIGWWGCKETKVIYPVEKDIIETVYASGKIISGNEYRLSAPAAGTILKKLVKDGDTVRKDQILYTISNEAAKDKVTAAVTGYKISNTNLSENSPVLSDLRLSLQTATVKCTTDSITYSRWKNLWEQHIGTKNNLDIAYTNYQVSFNQKKIAEQKYYATLNDLSLSKSNAASQLTTARKSWNDNFIRSEQEGIVYQTFKEAGETVNINEVVALLGDDRQRVIRMAVDQQDIDKIKPGQQVLLQTEVSGDSIYEAVVTRVYPVMNETDQTFRVDARFVQLPVQSFIHSSIEANIVIQKKSKVLVLPREVFVNKDSIWVKTASGETKTGVQTGISTLEYVEIRSGINAKTPVLMKTKEK